MRKIRDTTLRYAIRDARRLLAGAERDLRNGKKALERLREQELAAGKGRATAPEPAKLTRITASRRRTQALLRQLEHNVTSKRRQVRRLLEQAARLDDTLEQIRSGSGSNRLPRPCISGSQLRAARALLELTQGQMAGLLEINTARLRRLEKSTTMPPLEADVIATMTRNLRKAGIDLIPPGYYAGTGGAGVRLRRQKAVADGKSPPTDRVSTSRRKKPGRSVAA